MNDLFSRRMSLKGTTVGSASKNNAEKIMNATFTYDAAHQVAKLYDWDMKFLEEVDVKYIHSTGYSVDNDLLDYIVEFRPGYHPEKLYKDSALSRERMGFYIDLKDDTGEYSTWLIIGRDYKKQFVRYHVLKCNWLFKWISDGILYSSYGVIKSGGSSDGSLSVDDVTTFANNQVHVWLPNNAQTRTIDYNTRFIISENDIHPIVYEVTKRLDTSPSGIIKLTMNQSAYDPINDNIDLMVADYYTGKVVTDASSDTPSNSSGIHSSISCSVKNNTLIVAGSKRTLTGSFIDVDGNEVSLTGSWKIEDGFNDLVSTSIDGNKMKIWTDNRSLIGKSITVTFYNEWNATERYTSTIELEVCAR